MSRELTRQEKTEIRKLVTKWCANYDKDYGCLPLDCPCYTPMTTGKFTMFLMTETQQER